MKDDKLIAELRKENDALHRRVGWLEESTILYERNEQKQTEAIKELQEEIAFKNRVLEVCPLKEACCCANKNETDNGKQ